MVLLLNRPVVVLNLLLATHASTGRAYMWHSSKGFRLGRRPHTQGHEEGKEGSRGVQQAATRQDFALYGILPETCTRSFTGKQASQATTRPTKKPSSSYQSNAHARKPLPATINYTSGHITKQCGRLKK